VSITMRLIIALCFVFLLPCIVYSASSEHLADSDDIDARVVGGASSRSKYQVSLQVKVKLDSEEEDEKLGKNTVLEHFCGASFVNRNFVVTAAHCVDKVRARKIRVVGGRRRWAGSRRREVFEIKQIITHDNYTNNEDGTYDADIALIELATPVVFYNKMQHVELPEPGDIVDDKKRVILTGFGKEHEDDESFAEDLQKAKLKVINHGKCFEKYQKVDKEITDNMLCAAGAGKGPCHGDDGGPLMKRATLVGITSWYHGCANDKFPGVYVQVAKFVNWINEVIKA